MAERGAVPPGWPREVPPPTSPGWEDRACAWLLDLSPGAYRSYPLLRRYPLLLAWWAERNAGAQLAAARQGYSRARAELSDVVGTEVLSAMLSTLEEEGARLVAVNREVGLVARALRGEAYVPRL